MISDAAQTAESIVYEVELTYEYTYTAPVTALSQRLIVIPPDIHGDQHLVDHRLSVHGADDHSLIWHGDEFGNRVGQVWAGRVERAVRFDARYRLARRRGTNGAGPRLPGAVLADGRFLRPTALTAPDARLADAAGEIAAATACPWARCERAHEWTARSIGYQFGVTGVHTPAAMALFLGKGVCQDYAHILLCLLRLLRVPARYVSGHLIGEGAPHAWVEALVDDLAGGVDVIAYDPTHQRRTTAAYLTVAVGRDYADISPTSGHFSGPATGTLKASKRAAMVADRSVG